MKKLLVTMLVVACVLQAGFAMAVSNLHIGDMSLGSFTTSGSLWNGELRSVADSDIGMQVQSGDQGAFADPVYLILGIAGALSTDLKVTQTITSAAGTVAQGGGALAPGLNATWTAADGTNAYQEIGLGTQSSQNWGNWTGAYADLMGTSAPPFFGLFAYHLTNTGFDGTSMEIDFDRDLDIGTFVLGYSVFPHGNGTAGFWTPFTETGFVTPPPPSVPEPSTLLLLGGGLMGLAFWRRRNN